MDFMCSGRTPMPRAAAVSQFMPGITPTSFMKNAASGFRTPRSSFAHIWPSPFSRERHRYQLATEAYGRHRSPMRKTSFGVGRFFRPYSR